MPVLPAELLTLIVEFAPLFSKPVWEHAKVLLAGATLATGKRTAFADAIALVRRCLWSSCHFSTSSQSRDV